MDPHNGHLEKILAFRSQLQLQLHATKHCNVPIDLNISDQVETKFFNMVKSLTSQEQFF